MKSAFASRIKQWLLTLRKQNAAVVLATQSLSQLWESPHRRRWQATELIVVIGGSAWESNPPRGPLRLATTVLKTARGTSPLALPAVL
jgi:hypothetical protein